MRSGAAIGKMVVVASGAHMLSIIGQCRNRDARDFFAIRDVTEESVICDFTYHFGLQIPTREDSALGFAPAPRRSACALRFRKQ